MLVPSIISKERKGKRRATSFASMKVQRSSDFFEVLSCKDYEPVYTGRVIKVKVIEISLESNENDEYITNNSS